MAKKTPTNRVLLKNPDRPIGTLVFDDEYNKYVHMGLTKREYFAALAMQGILSNNNCDGKMERIANESVEMADYLLAELDKPNP